MNSVGKILSLTGNFTMLRYIENLSVSALERTVGFDNGRLGQGFSIVALAPDESLAPSDFELKASTRWSGGAIGRNPSSAGREMESILAARGQDVDELKGKLCRFFAKRGGNTPAKVLPNLRHTAGMLYPDAEALGPGLRSGIPQFNLAVAHRFVVLYAG